MPRTIERIPITLELGNRERWGRRNPEFLSARQQPGKSKFTFELNRKALGLPDLDFDQWWFDKRGLYGDRNSSCSNHTRIIECFWGMALRFGTAFNDREIQQTYILAKLLPFARSNGSRSVFLDSVHKKESKAAEQERLVDLNKSLELGDTHEQTIPEFYKSTRNLIGPPNYDEEIFELYYQMEEEILLAACEQASISGEQAVEQAKLEWDARKKKIGRRVGNEQAKTVLDILSYECRAAFHRCYSAVWVELTRELIESHEMCDESEIFHRFWHTEFVRPSNETDQANFHLFHGHIFGLHPGCSDFLQTECGQRLISELLQNPKLMTAYQRTLNGLLLSIFAYSDRYQITKNLRHVNEHVGCDKLAKSNLEKEAISTWKEREKD